MKKIIAFAAFAAALVTAASCVKERSNAPVQTTTKVLTLGFEENALDTKTYVRDYKIGNIWWSTNAVDKVIYVFDKDANKYVFASTSTTTEATREFSCDSWPTGAEPQFVLWSGKQASGSAPDASSVSGNVISGLSLSSAQTIGNANSFALNANIAVMKEGDTALRNVFGYIRYTVPAVNELAGIKAVSVTADEDLAGNVQIDYSGADPVATIVSDGVKSVSATTRFKDGYQAGTYYLVVPAGTYHNVKFTITPFAEGADVSSQDAAAGTPFTINAKGDVVIERGKFTSAGELPVADPNAGGSGGGEDDDDDDIDWPNDADAFDYGVAKGTTKFETTYPDGERVFYSHEYNVQLELGNSDELDEHGRKKRFLPLGDDCTINGITYYGRLYFYGNRMTTESTPGPSSWMDGYANIIPTSSAISWKINRPGILSYYAAAANQTAIDRGVIYRVAILKTVAGDTSAEIVYNYTPSVWDPFDRKPQNHPEAYFDLEITKDMLLGIDEAATIYLWAAQSTGKLNIQIHHFPFKWTPTAKETIE